MKISFDFDSTLSEDKIQKLVCSFHHLIKNEVFIITSRNKLGHSNDDLLLIAVKLGILPNQIHFTEGDFKWRKIKELGIDIHFDDVPEECELIAKNTNCLPLLLWDEFCKGSVKEDDFGKGKF